MRVVIQLKPSHTVSVERDVELRKRSYERATVRTDVTRKCKLQASFYCLTNMVLHLFFYPFEALLFCNVNVHINVL